MLTDEWLAGWAELLRAAVGAALRDVVAGFPFEAGEHEVGPPAPPERLAELRERMPWVPDGIVTLQRVVGPASLPDICNGYFLYSARDLPGFLDHRDGRPDRLDEAAVDVVVFGGNGGGDQYATTLDGRVFRLQEAGYVGGVYSGPGITAVADDLREFLEKLLEAVVAFGDGGHITDL
ncbi:hypothetical protein Ait01nite_039950 [Actinoplanes italicus]|uniref:SMI1/KNR4 family protein SUKH-1 n=1 Tax=Actinoplanes italicus TaxID=113567 RepID=A0A2T0JW94_9ACTN|nr:hypothetical protein [Actinoplanes italicus]PRX11981.1 hypothetical protein CLV67_1305 [Actinoplanes italicus]GIE30950.1 hypothetical protein Ait01nite_039950 [Actinoplanes italicus]